MAENFIFSYENRKQKCEDCIFDYKELEEKFITTFGLENDIKSELKFYIEGKEITRDDDLMDLIKPDNIIEVKNINEETKVENAINNEKAQIIKEEETKKDKDVIEVDKDETSKDIDSYISQKFKENNEKLEKNIIEKNEEKIQSLKLELFDEIEKKINNAFIENEINKKILDIDEKINKLNQDYIEFKSIKIKYFNKFIEILDNKSIQQDTSKKEQSDPTQKNEDIDNLKEQNNKLKAMIKKIKKEKDDMKDKFEKDLSSKGNLDNISPQLENLKKENEKLREENGNLNNKIKSLENELKMKSEKTELKPSSSLSSSRISQKKYKCRLLCKKDNIFQYNDIQENEIIELNLTIKNEGEDNLPKNCEIQLMNEINGLNLEEFKTKNIIKDSEEITLQIKFDIKTIKLNEDIDVRFKLVDDNKKDIVGGKCKLNIKIIKENTDNEEVEPPNNNTIVLEDNDYEELYNHVNDILQIENAGEDMSSFKTKLSELLENKKEKYESIVEKTDYIDKLKEDLEEIFS